MKDKRYVAVNKSIDKKYRERKISNKVVKKKIPEKYFLKTARFIENIKKDNNRKNYKNIKVACILDEFSYECFRYECELIPLTPTNWYDVMVLYKPDLLFVESAWQGLDSEWYGKVINLDKTNDTILNKIVTSFKNQGIPTVFWNKEDPVDFNIFVEAAKLFDYVFTTDENCIAKYKDILKHENVYVLPFAAQPKIHNPILKDENKIGRVAFAGGWYEKELGRRKEYMYKILCPAFKYNLTIYDRFSKNTNKFNQYPNIFKYYLRKGLSYRDIVKEYKKYNIFLNVNSVEESPTTFSRRVFELLACGIPVISSYALGIERFFKDIVKLCNSKEDTEKYLDMLLKNKEIRDRLSLRGQREVFENHTYKDRLEKILDIVEIDYKKDKKLGVSVITCTNRPEYIENIFNNFISQLYPKKQLIIVLNNNKFNIDVWRKKAELYDNIRVFQIEGQKSLGECLNFAVDKSQFEIISKFDDDDYYGPNYLVDIMNTFKYINAHIVGKKSVYAYFENSDILALRHPNQEYRYVYFIFGATLNVKREVFDKVRFQDLCTGEDTEFLISCLKEGYKIYSADRFNFLVSRRAYLDEHSWKMTEKEFLGGSQIINTSCSYKTFVTI